MNFGYALKVLKEGCKVQRSGWNGNKRVYQSFIPKNRDPVIFEGLCYILLSDGSSD